MTLLLPRSTLFPYTTLFRSSLRPLLKETPPIGLSYVQDIECQEPQEYEALLSECEATCTLAEQLGCPMVQLLTRSEEHTSELQSLRHLVCRLLLEKKKNNHH